MRGIFGAGVCDCLLDRQIDFPYCLGVSAGSANLISYIAGQRGRNYRFYTEYANRKAYMSFGNYVRKRSYFDLDYVYSTLSDSDGEDPVDFDAFVQSDKQFVTVLTAKIILTAVLPTRFPCKRPCVTAVTKLY